MLPFYVEFNAFVQLFIIPFMQNLIESMILKTTKIQEGRFSRDYLKLCYRKVQAIL